MDDNPQEAISNVIPVWGLTPDECDKILVQADKLISEGRASGVKEKPLRTYICIFDKQGAPYTITRDQRILHLLDPSRSLLMINKNIDGIMDMLDTCLPEPSVNIDKVV